MAHWNAHEERYTWLVTNLSRARVTSEQVGQVYRLRWQVELLFKEWKSYANLHAFDTGNASIAEGLISNSPAQPPRKSKSASVRSDAATPSSVMLASSP